MEFIWELHKNGMQMYKKRKKTPELFFQLGVIGCVTIAALTVGTTLLAHYMCFLRVNYSISAQFQVEISHSPTHASSCKGRCLSSRLIYDIHVMCNPE